MSRRCLKRASAGSRNFSHLARLRAGDPQRQVHLIAENSENRERWIRRDALLRPVHCTAQWNDDLHHVLHAAATGETGGQAMVYWRIYPSTLKATFTQAFTKGLADPGARVTELEWLNALADLRNRILKCACGTPNFLDDARADETTAGTCWSCGKSLSLPYRMKVGRQTVAMNADTRLYPHHLQPGAARLCDFSTPLAEMAQSPKDPARWGLRNLGEAKWVAVLSEGKMLDVHPGKAVPLHRGMGISFGEVEAKVL